MRHDSVGGCETIDAACNLLNERCPYNIVVLPTGGSLHLCMTPHGPDTTTYEAAIRDDNEQPKHLPADTLAFMFETNYMPRITAAALGSCHVDRNYYKCWEGLKSHFDKGATP